MNYVKKFILLFVALVFCACSQKAVYNENLPLDNNFSTNLIQKSAVIYVEKDLLNFTSTLKPLSKLGSDQVLSIEIYDFVAKSFKRFFDHIFYTTQITSDEKLLQSADFIIKPKIMDFAYGFVSSDGMDITAKTFVQYSLWISIQKNSGKSVFIKSCPNKQYFSKEILFAPGDRNFALIAPIFQKSINENLVLIYDEIIKSLE